MKRTRTAKRRLKSALRKLLAASASGQEGRYSRTELWVLNRVPLAGRAGTFLIRYEDGYLTYGWSGRSLLSALNARPPQDAPAPLLEIVAHNTEEYQRLREALDAWKENL